MAKLPKQEIENTQARFPKEALLRSQKYAHYRDLLSALLEDGKAYTHEEIEGLIDKFEKGKVI